MGSIVSGIVFSKDRALQLEATLRSFYARCVDAGLVSISVIFRCSNARHEAQYAKLQGLFPQVRFVPENDFRGQVISLLELPLSLFLVDDNIFVTDFSMADVVRAIAQEGRAIGFSLRLGRNTYHCYPLNLEQRLPVAVPVPGLNSLAFDWVGAEHDYGYPLEVSSSVYRRGEILPLFEALQFNHPNSLEGAMAGNARAFAAERPKLLCFEKSVTFCVPINKVQSVAPTNRAGESFGVSADTLADYFDQGRRIDIERLKGFSPIGCHQEIPLPFMQQNSM